MRPQEIIAKKRDGETLSHDEINSFIKGVCDEGWADYQISALVMACFLNGLDTDEQTCLTQAMLASGESLDFSGIHAPKADKHSTGGVGDKTSLIIAPLAAACGLAVPMISGRGLGHTGGTLDKLESIAGYNVKLSAAEFYQTIEKCGFALAGQTEEIVPADKKLYALRDATATVESIPLIVASIMSKKLAEGLDALVLDVKTGSGAFMKNLADSKRLAEALVKTGNLCGVRTEAVISDMSQPLGKYVGNALEVYECLKILRNETDEMMTGTLELSVELTARMLVLSKISANTEQAKSVCLAKLRDGSALEKFRHNIELQGGDARICDDPEILIDAEIKQIHILASIDNDENYVAGIDTKVLGEAISKIGGGRTKISDRIDYGIGYQSAVRIGDRVISDYPLGVLHYRTEEQMRLFSELTSGVYQMSAEKPDEPKLIKEIIS